MYCTASAVAVSIPYSAAIVAFTHGSGAAGAISPVVANVVKLIGGVSPIISPYMNRVAPVLVPIPSGPYNMLPAVASSTETYPPPCGDSGSSAVP